jgi:hypothetical protein
MLAVPFSFIGVVVGFFVMGEPLYAIVDDIAGRVGRTRF